VPRYSATVRLLSEGRKLKPVIVAMPEYKGPLVDGNVEYLVNKMIAEGIWEPEKTDATTGGVDESKVFEAGGGCEKEDRVAETLGASYDESEEFSEVTDFPHNQESKGGSMFLTMLRELREGRQTKQQQAVKAKSGTGTTWQNLGQTLEAARKATELNKLLAVLERIVEQKVETEHNQTDEG
jgi:hypothetical protein